MATRTKAEPKTDTGSNGDKKCPVTLEQFNKKAPSELAVTIAGKAMSAEKKEFSTGSFGYYINTKITLDVDGTPVTFQVGANITAVGSKPEKE